MVAARTSPPEPILTWEDVRGYNLSDRIWNIGEVTAGQIDLLLQESIAQGTASLTLAKRLEQFLLPGRTLPRTNRPYGTDASFNAMRLARSEITRSFSISTKLAGMLNPFVTRAYYHLSAVHASDPGDSCEAFAEESDANDGFPPDETPMPMVDTHPHCMCYLTHGVMSEDDMLELLDEDGDFTDEIQNEIGFFDNIGDLVLAILGLLPLLWDEIDGGD